MVTLAAGAVVLVPFPFSDLSRTKLRPALVIADAGRDAWILCQITSNPYGDSRAVVLAADAFASGTLRVASYVRPGSYLLRARSFLWTSLGKSPTKSSPK